MMAPVPYSVVDILGLEFTCLEWSLHPGLLHLLMATIVHGLLVLGQDLNWLGWSLPRRLGLVGRLAQFGIVERRTAGCELGSLLELGLLLHSNIKRDRSLLWLTTQSYIGFPFPLGFNLAFPSYSKSYDSLG